MSMASIPVWNWKKERVGELTVPAGVFDYPYRKHLVWEIERQLVEDDAKPLVYFNRGGTCRDPKVKGLTIMVNSIFNGWRMEDVWLDR